MIFPGLLHPLTLFKVRMLSLDRRYSPNLNAEQDPNDSSKERVHHDFIANELHSIRFNGTNQTIEIERNKRSERESKPTLGFN